MFREIVGFNRGLTSLSAHCFLMPWALLSMSTIAVAWVRHLVVSESVCARVHVFPCSKI